MSKKEFVVKTATHKCIDGQSFNYTITNFDRERREFTADMKVMEKLQSGKINPIEIHLLLLKEYGILGK